MINIEQDSYHTKMGSAYLGNAIDILDEVVDDRSVDLFVTSPPYALLNQKDYGNVDEDAYVDWFIPFARLMARKLSPSGSLVLNLGGAWLPGSPTRSLYIYRLLLHLCSSDLGFQLCQEFYWHNPAKLPTPIEWVNRQRVRVKDSVEQVFWLSLTDRPKADNRRVLTEYSESMKRLLKTKQYNWGERPSGHRVGKNWVKDNGGAITSNLLFDESVRALSLPGALLVQSNTNSQSDFMRYCRDHDLPIHPARFPRIIPEFFIRFLTDEHDLVCDPFAGSNTTGAVAEELSRRWVTAELDEDYFRASAARFHCDG